MRKLIATIIITIISVLSTIGAENMPPAKYSIMGSIYDKKTKKPIEYANIVVYKTSDRSMVGGSVSSTDGSFTIQNLKNDNYYLTIHFIGYEEITISEINFDAKSKEADIGSVYLSPASINLKETQIIGTNDYMDFKIDKTVVAVKEQISAEGGAVVDALVNVPSVQVDGGGNVTLRGSSSFTLLIDGQPSVLEASEALNQIPANNVDKIEIITNPSVKYDSDGTTGIINLVLKKQKYKGTSGQGSFTMATGDKYRGNALVNNKSNNIRSRLGASFSTWRKRTESKDYREVFDSENTDYQNIESKRDITRRNYRFNAGFDWEIDTSNTIGFDMEVGQWEFDRDIISDIYLWNNFLPDTSLFNDHDNFKVTNQYITGDLKFSHQFTAPHRKLDMSVFYSRLNNETPNIMHLYELDNDVETPVQKLSIIGESNRNHLRYKADYTDDFTDNISIETGYQFDYKQSDSKYEYALESLLSINNNDTSFIEKNTFSRLVNSFYGIINTKLLGIGIKAGIRGEYAIREQKELNSNKEYSEGIFSLFPSLHLSKTMKNNQMLSFSYSRRVNRPNEWMLIPTATSTGRNMLYLGNPKLLPDFTNSYEFGYTLQNDKLILNTQLFYRYTKNSIVTRTLEKSDRFFQTYENLDSEIASGLELMTNINFYNWWKISLTASGYYYKLDGKLEDNYIVDNQNFSWNSSFRTTFIVNHNTYLEFLAIYYGPSIIAQGNSEDFYYFDFFVKRNFLNRTLTVALRSHNTFDTGIYIEDTKGTNFNAHTWFKYEGPTFMATITYRFNNYRKNHSTNQPDMNFDSGLDH